MKRILITGINGFVGEYVAEKLLQSGQYEVAGVGRKQGFLPAVVYFALDIAEEQFLDSVLREVKRCDIIIHLAAEINFENMAGLTSTNVVGSYNICRLANEWGVSKVIFMSSVPVIGKPQYLPIKEDHPVHPRSFYHVSKLMGEQCFAAYLNPGIESVILRIPSPIGRGMNPNVFLSVLLRKCRNNESIVLYGKGMRKQNYIDVRDIADAVHDVVQAEVQGLFLLAGKKSVTNYELATMVKDITNGSSEILFEGEDEEEGNQWEIATEYAKMCFGFCPRYDLEDTVRWICEGIER